MHLLTSSPWKIISTKTLIRILQANFSLKQFNDGFLLFTLSSWRHMHNEKKMLVQFPNLPNQAEVNCKNTTWKTEKTEWLHMMNVDSLASQANIRTNFLCDSVRVKTEDGKWNDRVNWISVNRTLVIRVGSIWRKQKSSKIWNVWGHFRIFLSWDHSSSRKIGKVSHMDKVEPL